ncbi:MAG: LacI family DNA-binding transcriptional regulator [Paracoccaceae bacterium]
MNLRELSELLNLSQTTVSRALNGYPEVSESTRKRVTEAAAQHNYHPNAGAQSLATGRSMAIGHVMPMSANHEMVNVIFADFIAGASEIYGRSGYRMVVSMVDDKDELQTYRDLAQRRSVDGVMVHGPVRADPRIPLLNSLGLPFVVHGRSTGVEAEYNWLDVNNRRAIEQVTEHLISLGHRRIGFVNGMEHMDFAFRRRDGYLSALKGAGIPVDPALMQSAEMTEPAGHNAACAMLGLSDPATAFVSSSIVVTLGIRRTLEEMNLRIGQDISLASFDDEISALPNGSPEAPIYTAARSSVRAAGRRCAELLLGQIANPTRANVHELWEADLILGSSTRAIARRRAG